MPKLNIGNRLSKSFKTILEDAQNFVKALSEYKRIEICEYYENSEDVKRVWNPAFVHVHNGILRLELGRPLFEVSEAERARVHVTQPTVATVTGKRGKKKATTKKDPKRVAAAKRAWKTRMKNKKA